MIKVAPSILSADFSKLEEEIKTVKEAEYLHIDVMDGHFVPNITIGPLVLDSIKDKTDQVLDVHLMIENPDDYIEDFVKAGADMLVVHAEASKHLHRTIQNIKSYGVKAGVALNPATDLSVINYILEEVDMVLLMTVNPGFGGQAFILEVLPKISDLRHMIEKRGLDVDIQVDGGIKPGGTALQAVEAGANILVAGSAVFGADDRSEAIRSLKARK
ncbi:ribulose-phosphate 3-epimerase [Halonatronum saccharophilum]|uniref:ribulose-phosphate 3-epimerase n=1 Tax=Halonatronum saccharophilum TaxID=150060 RepID=UPI0004858A53|nr:ribulose-phosphate 3-epimerase [Halonatronum saccharophilum]